MIENSAHYHHQLGLIIGLAAAFFIVALVVHVTANPGRFRASHQHGRFHDINH
jgi:hypothetical protein